MRPYLMDCQNAAIKVVADKAEAVFMSSASLKERFDINKYYFLHNRFINPFWGPNSSALSILEAAGNPGAVTLLFLSLSLLGWLIFKAYL